MNIITKYNTRVYLTLHRERCRINLFFPPKCIFSIVKERWPQVTEISIYLYGHAFGDMMLEYGHLSDAPGKEGEEEDKPYRRCAQERIVSPLSSALLEDSLQPVLEILGRNTIHGNMVYICTPAIISGGPRHLLYVCVYTTITCVCNSWCISGSYGGGGRWAHS